jgi:hypothetical protein
VGDVVENAALEYLHQDWLNKVDGTMTTWDLAQVNGGVARMYWNACVVR